MFINKINRVVQRIYFTFCIILVKNFIFNVNGRRFKLHTKNNLFKDKDIIVALISENSESCSEYFLIDTLDNKIDYEILINDKLVYHEELLIKGVIVLKDIISFAKSKDIVFRTYLTMDKNNLIDLSYYVEDKLNISKKILIEKIIDNEYRISFTHEKVMTYMRISMLQDNGFGYCNVGHLFAQYVGTNFFRYHTYVRNSVMRESLLIANKIKFIPIIKDDIFTNEIYLSDFAPKLINLNEKREDFEFKIVILESKDEINISFQQQKIINFYQNDEINSERQPYEVLYELNGEPNDYRFLSEQIDNFLCDKSIEHFICEKTKQSFGIEHDEPLSKEEFEHVKMMCY